MRRIELESDNTPMTPHDYGDRPRVIGAVGGIAPVAKTARLVQPRVDKLYTETALEAVVEAAKLGTFTPPLQDFLFSVHGAVQNYGRLTEKQFTAVQNILRRMNGQLLRLGIDPTAVQDEVWSPKPAGRTNIPATGNNAPIVMATSEWRIISASALATRIILTPREGRDNGSSFPTIWPKSQLIGSPTPGVTLPDHPEGFMVLFAMPRWLVHKKAQDVAGYEVEDFHRPDMTSRVNLEERYSFP